MALTVTRVSHSGVLPDLASQRPLTGPWFPNGAASRRLLAFTPDGWPDRAGHSPSGHLGPLGQTPAQPLLGQVASSVEPRRFTANRAVFAVAAAGQAGEDALQAIGNAFGRLCTERTLPLMQVHADAACIDPEIQVATRTAFGDLRDSVERLTGLPPARIQRWFGTAMLMTAATAMNIQATAKTPIALTGSP